MTDPSSSEATSESTHEVSGGNTRTHCQSWAAGHRVHWIQGLRSNQSDEPGSYVACTVTDATDDGWFTLVVTSTGERFRYWNHDPAIFLSLVGRPNLEINERWSVMHQRQKGRGGSTCYVSVRETATPCVFDEPTGPLHERLTTHGGFSVSGPEVLRLIAESDGEAGDEPSD